MLTRVKFFDIRRETFIIRNQGSTLERHNRDIRKEDNNACDTTRVTNVKQLLESRDATSHLRRSRCGNFHRRTSDSRVDRSKRSVPTNRRAFSFRRITFFRDISLSRDIRKMKTKGKKKIRRRRRCLINGSAREFPSAGEDPAKMSFAKARRRVSSFLISATLIRGLLSELSFFSPPSIRVGPLSLSPLARWSTKLAREPRRPLPAGLLPAGPLVVSSCFVPSVPGAQCDIYGFLLGPCVEAAIIPKRARESERGPSLRRPSHGMDTGSKCSSQGRDVKPQPTTTVGAVAATRTMTTRTGRRALTSAALLCFSASFFFPKEKKKRCLGQGSGGEERALSRTFLSLVGLFTTVRTFGRDERVTGDYPLVVPLDPPIASARGKKRRGSVDRSGGALSVHENFLPASWS